MQLPKPKVLDAALPLLHSLEVFPVICGFALICPHCTYFCKGYRFHLQLPLGPKGRSAWNQHGYNYIWTRCLQLYGLLDALSNHLTLAGLCPQWKVDWVNPGCSEWQWCSHFWRKHPGAKVYVLHAHNTLFFLFFLVRWLRVWWQFSCIHSSMKLMILTHFSLGTETTFTVLMDALQERDREIVTLLILLGCSVVSYIVGRGILHDGLHQL